MHASQLITISFITPVQARTENRGFFFVKKSTQAKIGKLPYLKHATILLSLMNLCSPLGHGKNTDQTNKQYARIQDYKGLKKFFTRASLWSYLLYTYIYICICEFSSLQKKAPRTSREQFASLQKKGCVSRGKIWLQKKEPARAKCLLCEYI